MKLAVDIRQKIGADIYWFEQYNDYWFDLFRQPQDLLNEDGRITRGMPRRELRICIAEAEEQDFEVFNAITSAPDSFFSQFLMVGRLTEDGALGINNDRVFSRITGSYKTHRKLKDDAEVWQVLKEEFGIDYK